MEFEKQNLGSGIALCNPKDTGELLIHIYNGRKCKDFDPEYWCRLIEKAPRMESILRCNYQSLPKSFTYTKKEIEKILNYLHPKDDMVILRMSRKTAEGANFLKFEVSK